MLKTKLIIATFISSLLVGCGTATEEDQPGSADSFSIGLDLPDSLTGGLSPESPPIGLRGLASTIANRTSIGVPCAYNGLVDKNTILDNGYNTTRYTISIMASWTCVADLFIDIVNFAPHDGKFHETENDTLADDYNVNEPTHYIITADSNTQTTSRAYYGFDQSTPPTSQSIPGFLLSWNKNGEDIVGRLIISNSRINGQGIAYGDPANMRLDFSSNQKIQKADMFLQYDGQTDWMDGSRIEIIKDLSVSPFAQVFTTRGLMKMNSQMVNIPLITEVPKVQFYTVSDVFGNGAAIGNVQDTSLTLMLNQAEDNNLGNYLYSKRDIYFFKSDSDWEYIDKIITSATYRGGRTTPVDGGTIDPFNLSQDLVIASLNLDLDYFTGTLCGDMHSSCTELLNVVQWSGFSGLEPNIGEEPSDWRVNAFTIGSVPFDWRTVSLFTAINQESIYPNGLNWDGAFDMGIPTDL